MKISVITPSIRPRGLEVNRFSLMEQTFKDFEWLVDINWTGEHDLNASYNRLLRRSTGELIVSMQDYLKVRPDYLQRFWDAYQKQSDTFFTAPVGKVKDMNYNLPAQWDWRAYNDDKFVDMMPCNWDCWEIDSGAAPRDALFKIGGFDEALDQWWSFDNVSVGKRAEMAGYKFNNLFSNPALAFDHDAAMQHPFRDRQRPKLIEMRIDSYTGPLTYL